METEFFSNMLFVWSYLRASVFTSLLLLLLLPVQLPYWPVTKVLSTMITNATISGSKIDSEQSNNTVVNNNCNPRWTWIERNNKLLCTDCAIAIVRSTVYQMTIAARLSCTCNGTRAWTVEAIEYCNCARRSHVIGKRFGGPKWSVNCWCNPSDTEKLYTDLELLIADRLQKYHREPVYFTATFDGAFLHYNVSQTGWSTDNRHDIFEGACRTNNQLNDIWLRLSRFREMLDNVLKTSKFSS